MNTHKTNYRRYSIEKSNMQAGEDSKDEQPEKLEKPKKLFVRAKNLPVRIRTEATLNSDIVADAEMVQDDPVEIDRVISGFGSETGWGKLANRAGWVSMDHVVEVTE